jgi:hypothetical protein
VISYFYPKISSAYAVLLSVLLANNLCTSYANIFNKMIDENDLMDSNVWKVSQRIFIFVD